MRLGKEGDGQEEVKLKPDAGRRCSPVREQKVSARELCLLGRDGEPSSVASLGACCADLLPLQLRGVFVEVSGEGLQEFLARPSTGPRCPAGTTTCLTYVPRRTPTTTATACSF
ncbi:hypothetical protein C2845_PM02G03000 [Panicum miliaceum]|uniref:Uncharacterized protein n=1 Tax=Panicum miliaceum TaxID=4540 RepID=A0A3L6SHY4_PANMI|nr:hypothetical protein C2845_PM02G03000 [Panicum miliaceum]